MHVSFEVIKASGTNMRRPVCRPAALAEYGRSSSVTTEANFKKAAEKTLRLFTFLQIIGCWFAPICSHKDMSSVCGAFLPQRFKGAKVRNGKGRRG